MGLSDSPPCPSAYRVSSISSPPFDESMVNSSAAAEVREGIKTRMKRNADRRSAAQPQPNLAKRLECVELAPAFRSPDSSQIRQQAERTTPYASRQIRAACKHVGLLECNLVGTQLRFNKLNKSNGDWPVSVPSVFINVHR